jgi:hypothetical protein
MKSGGEIKQVYVRGKPERVGRSGSGGGRGKERRGGACVREEAKD